MKKKIFFFLLIVLLAGGAYAAGIATGWGLLFPQVSPPQNAIVNLLWETYDELKKRYIAPSELSDEKLLYGAIRGLVEASGDPYTSFFSPQEAQQFLEDARGHFGGIGAEIGFRNRILTVIAPLPDTPASQAGLRPGDAILSIDGKVAERMTLEEAISYIRGPAGTTVKLQILHEGQEASVEIPITRSRIDIPILKLSYKPDGIAVVELFNFSEDAPDRFRETATSLASGQTKGIILDLRNNPGGFLEAAIQIAGWFLPPETPAVLERQRDISDTTRKTEGSGALSSIPVVVLINRGTASAAEILAGALRDERGILLIGETTFGKGTIQEFPRLSSGAALKVTVGEWLTPKGISLRTAGLTPDIEIPDNRNGADPILERAIQLLLEKNSLQD